jgi:hypothetical protein
MNTDRTPQYIKLDERNHVEKPLLDQLDGLDWEIIDLDNKQHPGDTFRANLARGEPGVAYEKVSQEKTALH